MYHHFNEASRDDRVGMTAERTAYGRIEISPRAV